MFLGMNNTRLERKLLIILDFENGFLPSYLPQCATSWKNPDFRFAHFVQPKSDAKRAKQWVYLVGRTDFGIEDIKYSSIICERHFPPGSNLNWRRNELLEPFLASMKMETVEPADRELNEVANVIEPEQNEPVDLEPLPLKTYQMNKNIKFVTVPVAYGVRGASSTAEIDFQGIFLLNNITKLDF